MSTSQFWVDHFSPPLPELLETFLAMTPDDCCEILRDTGLPITEGRSCESAENRVFSFHDIVVKVYRPGRWSLEALQDEICFLEDLREAHVPFARPIGGVGNWRGLYYIIFEKIPKTDSFDRTILDKKSVRQMVQTVAAIHDVGSQRNAPARVQFDPVGMCSGCYEVIQGAGFLPEYLQSRYEKVIEGLIAKINLTGDIPTQRIHGDTYSGNIIWSTDGPVFIDLDDFKMGSIALDIKLLSSSWRLDTLPEEMDRLKRRNIQHELVLEFYREVRLFSRDQEALFPLLSACRDIEFDAWFSARWNQPGFAENYKDDDITNPDWWENSIKGLEESLHC